jgi:hypothetical protein
MSNALEYAMNKAKSFKTRKEFLEYLAGILPKLDTEQAKVAAQFIEDEVIKESRTNYYQYVKLMGPVLMGEFIDGRHIEIIAMKLQRAAERAMKKGTKRYKLKINMPPGASKTQLCSRMFGSWVIGRWPWAKLLICTHGLVFGRDEIGMKMLDIMRTDEYRKIFPEVELREDKQTAGRFLTTDDGEMLITSLSAGTSGRRGHLVLCGLNSSTVIEEKRGIISLDELNQGDKVLGESGWQEVTRAIADRQLVVYTVNGRIQVSEDHKFMTQRGWVAVTELLPTDKIKGLPLWTRLKTKMTYLFGRPPHIAHGKP